MGSGVARIDVLLTANDVGEGKAERGAFNAAKPGERLTVGWIGASGKLTLIDRSGTVRDLDVIAVEHETGRAESDGLTAHRGPGARRRP